MAAAAPLQHGSPCVHCGLCLNTCPTYRISGHEADSPRGRIYLMEAVDSGNLELDEDAAGHLDTCLGCLACESACPSGVEYARRIEAFRPRLPLRSAPRLYRRWLRRVATSAALLDAASNVSRLLDRAGLEAWRRRRTSLGLFRCLPGGGAGPGSLRAAPASARVSPLQRSRVPPPTRARLRVAVLTGCASDRLAPEINRAAVEALHRNAITVIEAPRQGCCGALAHHAGDSIEARRLALANAEVFERSGVDFVVTTAAGCTAHMREYPRLYGGEPSRWLAGHTREICELLVEVGFEHPASPLETQVAYHDACHLAHACGIRQQPRAVLEAAAGSPPLDLGENDVCCGSAGTYNLVRPAEADLLGARKAELAAGLDVDVVAAGNTGCLLQIERGLRLRALELRTAHPVELLAEAYRASDARVSSP